MNDETRLEAAHRGGHEDGAHGVQALNGQSSPAEVLMALEEAGQSEQEECKEAFWKGVLAAASRGMVFFVLRSAGGGERVCDGARVWGGTKFFP